MIDYEKLKEVHEILNKMPDYYADLVLGCDDMVFELYDKITDQYESFYTVEELLNKLNQLTQPQPKYKIGDKVYVLEPKDNNFIPNEIIIEEMKCYNGIIWFYGTKDIKFHQSLVFPTLKALIQHQIDYWIDKHIEEFGTTTSHFEAHRSKPAEFDCPPRWISSCQSTDNMPVSNKECQHESDGMIYCSNPPQNRCKTCGEFYK